MQSLANQTQKEETKTTMGHSTYPLCFALTPFMSAFQNKTNKQKTQFPKLYQRNCLEKMEKIGSVLSVFHLFAFGPGEKKVSSIHASL